MSSNFTENYFALFGLPERFSLDVVALDQAWRVVASEVHPDRFAKAGEAEKRVALMMSTRANEAYRTLKSPLSRARYLLSLAGVDTQEDTNTSMPAAFLMQQMEWREALGESMQQHDSASLEQLSATLATQAHELQLELAQALDEQSNFSAAALLVRKLRFLEKLEQEIDDALEQLLS